MDTDGLDDLVVTLWQINQVALKIHQKIAALPIETDDFDIFQVSLPIELGNILIVMANIAAMLRPVAHTAGRTYSHGACYKLLAHCAFKLSVRIEQPIPIIS